MIRSIRRVNIRRLEDGRYCTEVYSSPLDLMLSQVLTSAYPTTLIARVQTVDPHAVIEDETKE